MPFKEGVDIAHVHAFRALRAVAAKLDEDIDSALTTPHEALEALLKATDAFPPEPKAAKKEKAHA